MANKAKNATAAHPAMMPLSPAAQSRPSGAEMAVFSRLFLLPAKNGKTERK